MVLLLDDMNVIGIRRLQLLVYCQFCPCWTLIFYLLLCIALSFMFQKWLMKKEAHHTSSLENIYGSTHSFSNVNMDFGWFWYKLSIQDFSYCCKTITLLETWCFQFVLLVYSFILLYHFPMKLEFTQYLVSSLIRGITELLSWCFLSRT